MYKYMIEGLVSVEGDSREAADKAIAVFLARLAETTPFTPSGAPVLVDPKTQPGPLVQPRSDPAGVVHTMNGLAGLREWARDMNLKHIETKLEAAMEAIEIVTGLVANGRSAIRIEPVVSYKLADLPRTEHAEPEGAGA